MKNYLEKRIRNKAFWFSLVSSVLVVLASIGVKVDNEYIMGIVTAIAGFFTILGVFNDPTTENAGFGDDKPKQVEPEGNQPESV